MQIFAKKETLNGIPRGHCIPCETAKLPLPRPVRLLAGRLGAWLQPDKVCNIHDMTLNRPGNMVQILTKRTR